MRADLRHRLLAVARGEVSSKTGVTGVTGVTGHSGYVPKPLELHQLRELQVENYDVGIGVPMGVTKPVTHWADLDDSISERLASIEEDGVVPTTFQGEWARLNCARPPGVTTGRWLKAIVAGGLLLDKWGARAAELGWHSDELFALVFGLAWQLADLDGATVSSLDLDGADITTQIGERHRYRRRWEQ